MRGEVRTVPTIRRSMATGSMEPIVGVPTLGATVCTSTSSLLLQLMREEGEVGHLEIWLPGMRHPGQIRRADGKAAASWPEGATCC